MNYHPKFGQQQNQKTHITEYQETIPNRKLTVKRGVFPYAIHANPVSKREMFGKDTHISNKNNAFQMPRKNTFNLFDKKISKEEQQSDNKTKPSTSTGFFDSNSQQHATPVNFKKPQNDVTLSNTSNTTEMNKNILLNQYVTEQYNAVFKTKTSTIQPKYVNFDAQEALQICTYKQIGEVLNQSFIEASSKFKCSLEKRSSIRENLRKLYKERKKERNLKDMQSQNTTDKCDYTTQKRERLNNNFKASFPNNEPPEKKQMKHTSKSNHMDTNFQFNNTIPENDTLSRKKGSKIPHNHSNGGNDKNFHRSPKLSKTPEKKYGWRNLTPLSSPITNHHLTRNFGKKKKKKQKSDLSEKLVNRSPLLPTPQEMFPQNNHPKCEYKTVNSPTLFFSDTEKSIITPKVDKSNTKMPSKDNLFSLDSAVFKRKFSPELINPIDLLKGGRKKTEANKKKNKRKKILTPNPSYSDSTCHGINAFKRNCERDQNEEFRLKYEYSEFGVGRDRYKFS